MKGILEYNTSIEVSCLDCLKTLVIYPEDVTDFFDLDEVEVYLYGLGWNKRYFDWRCPECTKKDKATRNRDNILVLFE